MNRRTAIEGQNLQEHLNSARNAAAKGQAQYETPLEWADAIGAALMPNRPIITDLSCGSGSLAAGVANNSTDFILGVDIENCKNVSPEARCHAEMIRIHSDVTVAARLLDEVKFRADLFVLNPPWDLHWYKERLSFLKGSQNCPTVGCFELMDPRLGKDCIDSTVASILMALHWMTERGDGVVIANDATMNRLIFAPGAPYRILTQHFWLNVRIKGNPCSPKGGDDFITGVYYFHKEHHDGPRGCNDLFETPEQLKSWLKGVNRHRIRRGPEMSNRSPGLVEEARGFKAVRDELKERAGQKKSKFNIFLTKMGTIETQLSTFDKMSVDGDRKEKAAKLQKLQGQRPMNLVVQQTTRQELLDTLRDPIWNVDPKLVESVRTAVAAYHSVRAPIHELPPIQRLGYLDEESEILCHRDLSHKDHPEISFKEGERYRVSTKTVSVKRTKKKYTIEGKQDEFLLRGKELAIIIEAGGQEFCFMDRRHRDDQVTVTEDSLETDAKDIEIHFSLQDIAAHFHIPDVPDVTITQADAFNERVERMDEFERIIRKYEPDWKFMDFQRKDLPANSLHNGSILAWDTGLGKTIAAMIYPLLQVGNESGTLVPSKPTLLVSPGSLHDQTIEEFKRFGIPMTKLDSQDTFYRIAKRGHLSSGWYITSFTQLCTNKIEQTHGKVKVDDINTFRRLAKGSTEAEPKFEYDVEAIGYLMQRFGVTIEDAKEVPGQYDLYTKAIALCQSLNAEYNEGVGEEVQYKHGKVKCVFSPSLAELCGHQFKCIVIDEATRIKSEDSLIGIGCRALDPQFRLVMTATPVKNRLPDMFWLMWWAAGGLVEGHARFPYQGVQGAASIFEEEFLVCERNLTKEAEKRKGKKAVKKNKEPRGRKTAEVCNIHRLWKLVGPIVSRRRKTDVGEIVAKIRKPIVVPMGYHQADVYEYHLEAEYLDKNGRDAIGARLQALRSVAAAPNSDKLKPGLGAMSLAKSEEVRHRSRHDYTPKMAAALNVIAGCLERREQVAVFSGLHEPNDTLGRRLKDAGVPFFAMDGRVTEAKRGVMSRKFKLGLPEAPPVSLNGLGSMGEGHNWYLCRNVILTSFDWAFNLFEQAINRVHRMTSKRDVFVWPIICEGSIDMRLESQIQEKSDSSELILDGSLMGDATEEVNFFELLKDAREDWEDNKKNFEDEAVMEQQWPELKERLSKAWAACLAPPKVHVPVPDVVREIIHRPATTIRRRSEQLELL